MLIWEGGGGGICINIYFFYHMENVEHNNWSGKCGNGVKRSEIRNRGTKNLESGNRRLKNMESGIWLPLIHPPINGQSDALIAMIL